MEAKKKKIDGLLSLLANEATADSRRLLSQYGMPDAKNHKDLELVLVFHIDYKNMFHLHKRIHVYRDS